MQTTWTLMHFCSSFKTTLTLEQWTQHTRRHAHYWLQHQNCTITTTCQMKPNESSTHSTHATLQDGSSAVTSGKLGPVTAYMNYHFESWIINTTSWWSGIRWKQAVTVERSAHTRPSAGFDTGQFLLQAKNVFICLRHQWLLFWFGALCINFLT